MTPVKLVRSRIESRIAVIDEMTAIRQSDRTPEQEARLQIAIHDYNIYTEILTSLRGRRSKSHD